MVSYVPDLTFFSNIFTGITIFGQTWIAGTLFAVLSCLIVTNSPQKSKILLLPMAMIIDTIGMTINWIVYAIGGFLFVQETIGFQNIGDFLQGRLSDATKMSSETIGGARKRFTKSAIAGALAWDKTRSERAEIEFERQMGRDSLLEMPKGTESRRIEKRLQRYKEIDERAEKKEEKKEEEKRRLETYKRAEYNENS